jgi:Lhr-like helicase
MKAENVDVLVSRLGDLVRESKAAIVFLNKYKNAEDVVAALSAEQKTDAMAEVAAMAANIAGAYQAGTEVFAATERIEETIEA